MATAPPLAPLTSRTPTLGDVLTEAIPPARVLLRPTPGTATPADVLTIHDREGRLCELVDGTLLEKTMGSRESYLAYRFGYFLMNFTEPRDLGSPLGPDGMIQLAPGQIRIPDVAFYLKEKLPGGKIPAEAVLAIIPDLVVEVLSPSNTAAEMDRKLAEYFAAGVRLVWYVDPRQRLVWVHEAVDRVVCLDEAATLDGGAVLPGFALKVADWLD